MISNGVNPEETFVDTQNLPGFDRGRFEGVLEQSLGIGVFLLLGGFFLLTGLFLSGRAAYLTLVKGDVYGARAKENNLLQSTIVPERGVIYDRFGELLAFNIPGFRVVVDSQQTDSAYLRPFIAELATMLHREPSELQFLIDQQKKGGEIVVDLIREWDVANRIITQFKDISAIRVEPTPLRAYMDHPALSHVVGYVSRVTKEDVENDTGALLWGELGRTGIERMYDKALRGVLGVKIVETDSQGAVISEGIYQPEEHGKNITISIWAALQKVAYEALQKIVEERGFTGGSVVVLDARTSEVLSLVSYPGFDANALSRGTPADVVSQTLADARHPLFFRPLAGLYSPGSIIKPFLAAAALEEGIIEANTIIYTEGQLVVPNPYNPDKPSIFNDWKNHGAVDMVRAIAVSSDVYFYIIGGGYKNQEGLGPERIRSALTSFGIGSRTGIDFMGEKDGNIPNKQWKAERYPEDPLWRVGDTYNISIGQGGMLATPLQMARSVLALANGGILLQPRLARLVPADGSDTAARVPLSATSLAVAREGMRQAVREGTAMGVADISIPVAGKTGTAEIGKTGRVHSWFVGFLPWNEDTELVLVVNLENGSAKNLVGATAVAHEILRWYVNEGRSVIIDKY